MKRARSHRAAIVRGVLSSCTVRSQTHNMTVVGTVVGPVYSSSIDMSMRVTQACVRGVRLHSLMSCEKSRADADTDADAEIGT